MCHGVLQFQTFYPRPSALISSLFPHAWPRALSPRFGDVHQQDTLTGTRSSNSERTNGHGNARTFYGAGRVALGRGQCDLCTSFRDARKEAQCYSKMATYRRNWEEQILCVVGQYSRFSCDLNLSRVFEKIFLLSSLSFLESFDILEASGL